MLAVPGVSGSVFRTGLGSAATSVAVTSVGSAQLAVLDMQFPMVGTAEPDGDFLIVCHLLHAPPGGVWDETQLVAGQTFVYPPSSSQTAIDPEGLQFGLVALPWDSFEAAADTVGIDPDLASRRSTRPPAPSPMSALFAPLLCNGDPRDTPAHDAVLDAVLRAVGHPLTNQRGVRKRWNSRDLVREVETYLDRTGEWQVPMLTLCREVGASERRLEVAFRDQYDVTPRAFMRLRALHATRIVLRDALPSTKRVAEVARAHGFNHGGRFSSYYQAVFGERPSTTLHHGRTYASTSSPRSSSESGRRR